MNRNERRALEKAQEKNKKKPGAPSPSPATQSKAAQLKAQGMTLKNEGKEAEAVPVLIEALKLDSSLADVHFMLAMWSQTKEINIDMNEINRSIKDKNTLKIAYQNILNILKTKRQYKECLICQEEVCRLYPDDTFEKENHAALLTLAGLNGSALKVLAELIEQYPENKIYKATFIHTCGPVSFRVENPLIKKALQICFSNIYETDLKKAYSPWISLILCDPECSGIKDSEIFDTDEDLFNWMDTATNENLAFLRNRFFLDGIRLLIITDPVLETLLRRIRQWICINANKLEKEKRLDYFEPFLISLGEQCFFNEYIYPEGPEEKNIIDGLIERVTKNQESDISVNHSYALISSYRPLLEALPDKIGNFKSLSLQSEHFSNLLKTHVFDVLEEQKIKSEIRNFGIFENKVSKTVQQQYEENPYPRWISVINYPIPSNATPSLDPYFKEQPMNVLVAGCGTGRHAIGTAAIFSNSQITAIDLSRSSLAYAQRKANESGLANRISFLHADILSMKDWPTQFDVIESSGVLHHMEDPFKGWQVLTNLLKPGGYFKVGLYSEIARKEIAEAREYVKNNNFPSTLEGIRTCRQSILDLPSSNIMRQKLLSSTDFYATSVIRDLIFHVQEHRMTLPQIQEMMDKLGLACTRFIVSAADHVVKYDEMFPDDPSRKSLANWHILEQKYPGTFAGMYQFWCQKIT